MLSFELFIRQNFPLLKNLKDAYNMAIMKNVFKQPSKYLAAKLIIAIGGLMIVLTLIFWYAILAKQEKDIMSIAVRYGGSFVNFTKESIQRSMINFQPEETQRMIETLSTPEGVHSVSIYDHKGVTLFSSHKEAVGHPVDKNTVVCKGCHVDPEKSPALKAYLPLSRRCVSPS